MSALLSCACFSVSLAFSRSHRALFSFSSRLSARSLSFSCWRATSSRPLARSAREGDWYAGGLAEDEVVRRLALASGALGSSADYLFQTRDGLRSLGILDRRIERLAAQVEAVRQSEK